MLYKRGDTINHAVTYRCQGVQDIAIVATVGDDIAKVANYRSKNRVLKNRVFKNRAFRLEIY